jgi:hypothetical protein
MMGKYVAKDSAGKLKEGSAFYGSVYEHSKTNG